MFQSSPALTGGCYRLRNAPKGLSTWFQSSPALTGGCYRLRNAPKGLSTWFQSSPALTGGCYTGNADLVSDAGRVSILTRPYGRMLSRHRACTTYSGKFQSSPALTGGCYRLPPPGRPPHLRFNPHPPLRADAIKEWADKDGGRNVSILTRPYGRMLSAADYYAKMTGSRFQSSPALTGGCYA